MKLGMHVGLGPGHFALDGDPAPPPQRGTGHNFRPISVVVKWLDGLRCHLVWRQASAQATLCQIGNQLPSPKGADPPIFGLCLLWPNGWIDQDDTEHRGSFIVIESSLESSFELLDFLVDDILLRY